MKHILSAFLLAAAASAFAADPGDSAYPIASGPFTPDWTSLKNYECPEWFRDAKFGIWAHWGPQSVPEHGDWYARKMYEEGSPDYEFHKAHYGPQSKVGYKDIIQMWHAEKFDPDALMALYAKAGARYFVSMGVHHDNFDLWNSKYHRWNAVLQGPHKDIVGLWAAAARKYGLRFGVSEHLERSYNWMSFSKAADTKGPLAGVPYDGNNPDYADLYFPPHEDSSREYPVNPPEWWKKEWFLRIQDLVDSYHPDLLYTDGGIPFGEVGRRLVAHFYNTNIAQHDGRLEAVYNIKNWGGNHHVGDYVEGVAVQDVERGRLKGINPHPWQTDTSIGDWYYNPDYKYKSATQIIHQLADIVSKNGNLLINFTQRPDGTLDQQSIDILHELAAWVPINGEAIYGTRPWITFGERTGENDADALQNKNDYDARDVRYTKKGDAVYAIFLGWPGDNASVTLKALANGNGPASIHSVTLLGSSAKMKFDRTPEGLTVQFPDTAPCRHAVTLRID